MKGGGILLRHIVYDDAHIRNDNTGCCWQWLFFYPAVVESFMHIMHITYLCILPASDKMYI